MQHIGKLVGKKYLSVLNNLTYTVLSYSVTADMYHCEYECKFSHTTHKCNATEKELLDTMYFEEIVSLPKGNKTFNCASILFTEDELVNDTLANILPIFEKARIVKGIKDNKAPLLMSHDPGDFITNAELQGMAFDDMCTISCECGVDKNGQGKHSDYCPKYHE